LFVRQKYPVYRLLHCPVTPDTYAVIIISTNLNAGTLHIANLSDFSDNNNQYQILLQQELLCKLRTFAANEKKIYD
jgi:hypothetical protein